MDAWRILLATVAVVLVVSSDDSADDETKSLYTADDPILQLSVSNFNESIYLKPKAFFVEFYSSWCGHCINFAPTYVEFAKNVSKWKDVAEVGAINCALETNLPLCQAHEVHSYPTIKYFKYMSRGPDAGEVLKDSKQTVVDLVLGLTKMIVADFGKHLPSSWPNFSPVDEKTIVDDMWATTTSKSNYLIVVFESFAKNIRLTYVGAQIALDFVDKSPEIKVMTASDRSTLVNAYGVNLFPGVAIFKRGDPTPLFKSSIALTRQEMASKIKLHLKLVELVVDKTVHETKDADAKEEQKTGAGQYVHKSDLTSALGYIFYHEIGKFKHVSGDKLTSLKDFLEILSKYFPGDENEKRFLFRLIARLNEIPSYISVEDWKFTLDTLQSQFHTSFRMNGTWVACKGSKPKFRGYPCSLWTLFHVLTINAYKMDGANRREFKPAVILEAIKQFVLNFFGCKECRENFVKESENLKNDVLKSEDVVLWLWKVHNSVNLRLHGKLTEDPEHPKGLFPSKDLCPRCYSAATNSFDQNEVLKFLTTFYTKIAVDKSKPEVGDLDVNPKFKFLRKKIEGQEFGGAPQNVSSDDSPASLSRFDFSLCFALWVFSAGAIVLLFMFLKLKRSRHKFAKSLFSDYKI